MEIDQLVDTACERAGSDDLGDDTWREGLEVLVRSLDDRGRAQRDGRGRDDRPDRRLPRQPARGRAVVRPAPRDRRPGDRRAAVRARPPPHRVDRAELPARPGPGPAIAAHLGGGHAVPATGDRDRAHRPAHRRGAGRHRLHATRCSPGSPACCRPRATGPQECLLLMALDFRSQIFEGMALDPELQLVAAAVRHGAGLPLPPAGAEAAAVALPARPVVAQDPGAHALDRRARRGVPRRPVRHDPPRRRQGAAVGVRAVRHACRASSPNAPIPSPSAPTTSSVWRICARAADRRSATGATRTASTTSRSRPCSATRSAEVDRLYAELGDDLTDDARRRMQDWWAESSKERSGPHRYRARDVRPRPGRRSASSSPSTTTGSTSPSNA